VGRSNTGKTTVIERLIPMLVEKGIRVAVIKHHHHDFDIDIPGKDTFRYKKAGATMSILASPRKIAIVKETENELTLTEIMSRYVSDVDLLIIEGFKKEDVPKIEVFQRKDGADLPVRWGDKNLIALVTDEPAKTSLPVFLRDDIQGIAQFIIDRFVE
jgi:molybdopterin-guanine dinucleotide biosynthesis protein B